MNANAKRWIEELKTTTEKQGKGYLHLLTDDTYCCLGIGCKLFEKELSLHSHKDEVCEDWDSYETRPPPGFENHIEFINNGVSLIISMNDTQGKSFKEIALELETNPDKYFIS